MALIENVAIAKLLTDDIDNTTVLLKNKLANMSPLGDPAKENALAWSLRGEIQGLERFKKKLLDDDTTGKE